MGGDIHDVASVLDAMVIQAASNLNSKFSQRRLGKQPRMIEPLPTGTRQLSSYRTRIGTMLEYALSTELDEMLHKAYGHDLMLTFAVAHEFPDFYLRDLHLKKVLRIEMKAVDADSDEQAARFDVATSSLMPSEDLLLLIAWEWAPITVNGQAIGEYPRIFHTLVIAAADLAAERDVRLSLTGGKITPDGVFVMGKGAVHTPDPGNYGKLWRMIHPSRHESADLTDPVKKFLNFLREVDARAPRKRFK